MGPRLLILKRGVMRFPEFRGVHSSRSRTSRKYDGKLRNGQWALASIVGAIAASAHAQAVSWDVDASGLWTTAADWSSSPSLPGPTDNVTIDQPGSVTVTLSSGSWAIDSLVEDDTLTFSAGTLAVATSLQVNGVVNFSGGTLENATLSTGAAGTVNIASSIFDDVALASSLAPNGNMFIENGLTLADSSKLSIENGNNLYIYNGSQSITETDGGSGIVEFDGTGAGNIGPYLGSPTLTIGSSITVQTGTGSGSISTAGLINQGIISSQTSGKTLAISSATLTNSGTLEATNGGVLNISGAAFTNSGSLLASDGALVDFTTATVSLSQLGSFSADPAGATSAGTIEIAGTLNNTGLTLALTGGADSLLIPGTIQGGTISTLTGLTFTGTTIFDGVTLGTSLAMNANLFIEDGLTLANSSKLSIENGESLYIYNGSQSITETDGGSGIVEFDGTGAGNIGPYIGSPTLTIGSSITVQTGTGSGSISTAGLINQGIISSQTNGKTLTISSATFTNFGALQATNGSVLDFTGATFTNSGTLLVGDGALDDLTTATVSLSQLGTFSADPAGATSPGTIEIAGTLNNTGSTLALTGGADSLLIPGTIEGGTISTLTGLTFTGTTTLSDVTLGANLPMNANLFIENGLTLADSSKLSIENGDELYIYNGSQSITETDGGSGIVEFDGTGAGNIAPYIGSPTLTIGSSITVQTGTGSGSISTAGLINQGIISSQTSGKTLTISSTTFTNSGTVETSNGGVLSISSSTSVTNTGQFTNAGTTSLNTISNSGTFTQTGTLTEAGNFLNSGTASFGGTQNWTKGTTLTNSAGLATFESDAGSASAYDLNMNVTGGLVTLETPQHWQGLTVSGSGVLDITNNHIIITYTGADPVSSIAAYIKSGYNGGFWNGPGVISSTAQTLTDGLRYGVGWADGSDKIVTGLTSGEIELKYTLLGDANLDGTVNGSDFSILAANFGLGVTNWDQGNFLFSSSVNGSDFSALAANFGQGDNGADLAVSPADIAALDAFAVANDLPLPTFASVPEPGCASSLHRRKRRTSAPSQKMIPGSCIFNFLPLNLLRG